MCKQDFYSLNLIKLRIYAIIETKKLQKNIKMKVKTEDNLLNIIQYSFTDPKQNGVSRSKKWLC